MMKKLRIAISNWLTNFLTKRTIMVQNHIPKKNERFSVYLGNYRILTNTVRNDLLILDSRDLSLTPHIIKNGTWEERTTITIENIVKEGMVVVDVGANIGYYTVIMGRLVGLKGKVFAFEVNNEITEILKDNCDINCLFTTSENITICAKAVTDQNKKLQFKVLKNHMGSSSVMNFDPEFIIKNKDTFQTKMVDGVSLDSFFPPNFKIDFIRIDAEGSELLILDGMKRIIKENPNIIIMAEYNKNVIEANGQDTNSFISAFTKNGFSAYNINDTGLLNKCDSSYLEKYLVTDLIFKKT
jgi:FkbM family methyltransferase